MAAKSRSIVVTPLLLDFADGSRVLALALGTVPDQSVEVEQVQDADATTVADTTSLRDVVAWAESWSQELQ